MMINKTYMNYNQMKRYFLCESLDQNAWNLNMKMKIKTTIIRMKT